MAEAPDPQWPVDCDICIEGTTHFCNTCGSNLCYKCAAAHLNDSYTQHHDLVSYAERKEPQEIYKIACEIHVHESYKLESWCSECKKLACPCCAETIHKSHNLSEAFSELERKRSLLRAKIETIKQNSLPQVDNMIDEITKMKENCGTRTEHIEKSLISQAEEIHKQVNMLLETTRKSLQELNERALSQLHHQEQTLLEARKKLTDERKNYEDILLDIKGKTTLEYQIEEDGMRPERLSIIHINSPVLIPGRNDFTALPEMLGSVKSDHSVEFLRSDVISSLDSACFPLKLACAALDTAWLTNNGALEKRDRNGNLLDKFETNFDFQGMIVSKKGEIFFADTCSQSIQKYKPELRKLKVLFKTKWIPCEICLLYKDYNKDDPELVVTFESCGRILRFNNKGKVLHEVERGLFRHPTKLAVNKVNNAVYICDKDDTFSVGRVVALDFTCSTTQFIYNGPEDETFSPIDLCTDFFGKVFIADYCGKSIRVLDKEGRFLQNLPTAELGIENLQILDVDGEGNLWNVDINGRVVVTKCAS